MSLPPGTLERLIAWYDTLSPASLPAIRTFYSESARFRDPFNDLDTRDAIEALFADMFRKLGNPRFAITDTVAQDQAAFLTWTFRFTVRGRTMEIIGGSHLKFDAQGRVCYHRDYWDAAEELYEKLPGIGTLLRLLKKCF